MKHFIELTNWSTKDLWHILQLSTHLKMEWQTGGNKPILKGKILGMVFQKPSLRTRVSFEVAMKHLGGDAIMMSPNEIGLGKRESIADIARVLSRYVQCLMARVFEHEHVIELAKYSDVPVINGLSDSFHPCQAMADMMTIFEHFGRLRGLRLAYIGDGNNVAASLLNASAHFGMNYAIATPEGYELPAMAQVKAAEIARKNGAVIEVFRDPKVAVTGADVVYTDTWVSMGQEEEAAQRKGVFEPYQVNKDLLSAANDEHIVLHCLPAHRGEEITDEVADGPTSVIFDQAENRLHIQKAILVKLLALS